MVTSLHLLPRAELDTVAWDTCVRNSVNRLVYGYSWYLDAVLPEPDWKWMGLVSIDEVGNYQAVMPVPLRRKFGRWVVHQPLFCQFITVFSPIDAIDLAPFYRATQQRFRYGSKLSLLGTGTGLICFERIESRRTYVLDLRDSYEAIARSYSQDRRLNVRRVQKVGWQVINSNDILPLITLFRTYHATSIGVGEWAYPVLIKLYESLRQRQLATVRYALLNGRVEAGALFVREGGRIIYLFNAASITGRSGNARTLLIDQLIQQWAGQSLLLDFESPEKPSIAQFYRSFGAVVEDYQTVFWNRLTYVERLLLRVKNGLT